MDITGPEQLRLFFEKLGQRCKTPTGLYVFGGSAIVLMGGTRHTGDVDFTIHSPDNETSHTIIAQLADETGLDLEESNPAEFMPLPTGAEGRHQLLGQYGQLTVYIFDLYSIAVMKIDRAFQTDMQDVRTLIEAGHIHLHFLEECVEDVARRYDEPMRLRSNFAEMKRGLAP